MSDSLSTTAEKGKAKQPDWIPPFPRTREPVLKVYNSMTKAKNDFVPMNGKLVKWYNCGPTVYDAAHLGHARNYVTQDIIRRILVDYFGYDVHFVINVTDIDDKIIQRARYNYLVSRLQEQTQALTSIIISNVEEAFTSYLHSKLEPSLPTSERLKSGTELLSWLEISNRVKTDTAWTKVCSERDEKFTMHVNSLNSAFEGLLNAKKDQLENRIDQPRAHALIRSAVDILGPWLDNQYKSEITDHSIFRSLAAYWEDQFMTDMASLRVQPPDTLTRVTEYVPEIVAYVERIIKNGYAYSTGDGSVYFDTRAFDGAKRPSGDGPDWTHAYAKLMPWNKGNKELLEEGEGTLSSGSSKRSAADFALWKASKPGEPAWPSPWGPGRPGWHIECSVMATEILGDNMDIHSGGVDLAFPHHDNELAQSEAYHDCQQWVNYFMHTGHLHIEGLKMSKSLKNFITIEDALKLYTARQLRLVFLGQLWSAKMDFRESALVETKTIETTFDNFFITVKGFITESKSKGAPLDSRHHYEDAERELTAFLHQTQHAFRIALCDSFNTPDALARLVQLVSRTNVYLSRGRTSVNIGVVQNVAAWVTKMLRMFGLAQGSAVNAGPAYIGWGSATTDDSVSVDRETVLLPYLRVLSTFRDDVRRLAISQAPARDILALSDRLRDVDLVPLGVALDDQEDGRALVKLVDPDTLQRAREEKAAVVAEKAAKKAAQAEADLVKKRAKLERGRLPPYEMFKPPNVPEGLYGSWNEDGIPLTDGTGVELNKSRGKKLTKEWEIQKKLHTEWEEWVKSQAAANK